MMSSVCVGRHAPPARLPREPIAIIGIGCRLPGDVNGPEAFWRLVRDGVDAVTEIPPSRGLDVDPEGDARVPDGTPGRIPAPARGGFLAGIDQLDAGFFALAPREAERLDPQQRLLLEVAWEALEDAGLPLERVSGTRTGVFVGLWLGDYEARLFRDPRRVDFHMTTGSGRYAAAGRLSYQLDLTGPSLVVDTACSSSLVAIHLACQSLWSGASTLALAGGANVILQPHIDVAYGRSGMLAADGRCKFGDARADGYVRSEGAGIVVLKPLAQALADGDRVYAAVLGGAVNNDGRGSGHLVTPAASGQADLLRSALADAGVNPGAVAYVEAHGTGTAVGDPIELAALGAVLADGRDPGAPCAVGSVKTNLGHTEGAAGVAGLIKAALALHRRVIPPSLHFETPNPAVPWAEVPVYVPRAAVAMPPDGEVVAGVSAFGITGTNAHLVLASPPSAADETAVVPELDPAVVPTVGSGLHLVPLSARSPAALRQRARDLASMVRGLDGARGTDATAEADDAAAASRNAVEGPRGTTDPRRDAPVRLADIAYTAAVCRTHHAHRAAIVAADVQALAEQLATVATTATDPVDAPTTAVPGERNPRPKVALVFPGQGGQWVGMARSLLGLSPVTRGAIERCEAALRPFVDWSLVAQLGLDPTAPGYRLDRIEVIQPTLVAIAIALADQLRHWGIAPDAVIGHSLGEVAAAYVAGALDIDDAMRVIAVRSRLMQRTSGRGAMAVIGLPAEATAAALGDLSDRVGVAVMNGPAATVVSGDPDAVETLLARLGARDVFGRRIQVDVASHGPQMAPLLPELRSALADLRPRQGTVPMYSTTVAEIVGGACCDADYWARNLGQPVRFGPMVRRLLDDGFTAFVELGPHPVLTPAIREAVAAGDAPIVAVPAMRRDDDRSRALLEAVGALYEQGSHVDWARIVPAGRRVRLPRYPWQRERHWFEPSPAGRPPADSTRDRMTGHGLPGRRLSNALPTFETTIRPPDLSFAAEHRLFGRCVAPVAVHVALALAAARAVLGDEAVTLSDVVLSDPLVVPDDGAAVVQTAIMPDRAGGGTFQIHGRAGDASDPGENASWTRHAAGALGADGEAFPPTAGFDPVAIQTRCIEAAPGTGIGPGVQAAPDADPTSRDAPVEANPRPDDALRRLWHGDGEALGWIEVPPALRVQAQMPACHRHPAVLDAALRPALAALPDGPACVVAGIERLRHARPLPDAFWSHATVRTADAPAHGAAADVRCYDTAGRCVLAIDGLRFHALDAETLADHEVEAAARSWLYEVAWEPSPRPSAPQGGHRAPTTTHEGGTWLIFADRAGLGAAVAERLRGLGHGAALVDAGPRFAIREDGRPAAGQPGAVDDDRRRLAAATADGRPLSGVVFAWGLDAATADDASPARLVADQASLLNALAGIAHLLAPLAGASGPRVWVVTRGAQAIDPGPTDIGTDTRSSAPRTATAAHDTSTALAQAPLWGLGRVFAIEHPRLWGGLIDLAAADPAAQADAVLAEILGDHTAGDDEVAWRGGRRQVPRLVRRAPGDGSAPDWRTDGAHLITGGLGRVGLAVARWLARGGVRHIVLTSRTGLPDRASSASLADHASADDLAGGDAIARRIAHVRAIESLGATVTVVASDAADADDVRALMGRFGAALPPLRGVWHAAADLGGAAVAATTTAGLTGLLRAKVGGAWALHRATMAADLDAFVMFSSTTALWGARDLAAYAAANGFLDALAHHRRGLGLPALSINWGIWAEQSGSAREIVDHGARVGLRPMPAAPALALMGRLIAQGAVRATVAAIDWPAFKSAYTAVRPRPFLDRVGAPSGAGAAPSGPAPALAGTALRTLWLNAAPPDRREAVIAFVRAEVAAVLGHRAADRLDIRRGLFDLGLDSILAMQLRRRLEAALDRPLSPTVIFSHPTIAALAGFVDTHLAQNGAGSAQDQRPASGHPPAADPATGNGAADAGLLRRFEAAMAAVDDLVGGA